MVDVFPIQRPNLPIFSPTPEANALAFRLGTTWDRTRSEEAILWGHHDEIQEFSIETSQSAIYYNNKRRFGSVFVGVASAEGMDDEIIVTQGTNTSIYQGAPKDCAEVRSLVQADGVVEVMASIHGITPQSITLTGIGIFVAHNRQQGLNLAINNLDSETVDPCGTPCRPFIDEHPATTEKMRIVTTCVDELGNIVASRSFLWPEMIRRYANVVTPLTQREVMARTPARSRY
ncbi:MAG: hypothetical protein WBP26_03100 [Candidatus Saccharimonadales bacterium]